VNRRLLVDLEALAANYQVFQAASRANDQARVGGVVKANAYGIGANAAVETLQRRGCSSFFVATLDEALSLKSRLAPEAELFVFEGADARNAAEFAGNGVIPVLNDPEQLSAWQRHRDHPAAIHFDTGMARLGFAADTAPGLFAGFNLALVMTHLACADTPEHPQNARQAGLFERIAAGFPGIRTSIGNSAGWLIGPPYQGDLGRPGIGLYGGNPFAHRPSPVAAVASLQGRILQLRSLAAGEAVGYGGSWVAERETRIAAVGLGYADGLPRHLSGVGEMALADGGRRCRILGRVSMDTTVIDVSSAPEAGVGDWVEAYGRHISVDEAAERAGTLSYELLTGVGARVPRVAGALD
jgi:alanine racemase